MVANQLAELIRRLLNCKRVSITTIDPLTGELQASAVVGLEPELEQAWRARQLTLGNIMGDTVAHARMRAGEAVVVDWREPPLVDRANPFGICTMIMAPLLLAHYPEDMPLSKDLGSSADEVPQRSAPGKRLMGILLLDHAGEPYEYSDEEIALTRAVAQLAALTLEQERLLFGRTQARASIMALRETNHLMNEFLGIAGHELRTPLTTVKACVQLAKRQLGRALHQQERLPGEIVNLLVSVQDLQERTERQVGMQNRLVSDLLDVSRIQNDRLELHLQRVNLIALVREAVEDQQFLVPSRPVGLSLAQADDIIVQADADRIRQVISNYLSNALKYSEPDTPVEVYIEGNAATVRVLVQDEGPGLTQQQQQHIWDRFYRVPGIEVKSGSGVGLGLGLHISRIIIERHSGQVGLESTPGQGSTFWFSLPLLPA